MVEDFAILKKDWREFIDDVLDHSYLHHVADPLADILKKENAELRLLPFPGDPTTELVSLLCFNKMEVMLAHRKLQDIVRVKSLLIQETPTNAIQLDLDDKVRLFATLKTHTGWWADVNLHSRSIINVG